MPCGRAPCRERDQGARAGHVDAHVAGAGRRTSGRLPDRRPVGAQLRPRSGARTADGDGCGGHRRGGERTRPEGVARQALPALCDRRRGRRRDRWRVQERHRDRRRRGRRAGPGAQRAGWPGHTRAGGDDAPRRGDGRPARDAGRPEWPRRPRADVHGRRQPQSPPRRRAGRGTRPSRRSSPACAWWPRASTPPRASSRSARPPGVELPIAEQMADVLAGRTHPMAATEALMLRPQKHERH